MTPPPTQVVAGVIRDAQSRVLLAQRPSGKDFAGCWEFPGGKREPGENALDALRRELREELGITVEAATPLIAVPHRYAHKHIVLDAWSVDRYVGDIAAREGQALRWASLGELDALPMPAADLPIGRALRLPERYLITPPLAAAEAPRVLAGIERACRAGIRLIQFRQPHWPPDLVARSATAARDLCAACDAQLLLHADRSMADALHVGVHLPARLAARLAQRSFARERWCAVSCHDAVELRHAEHIGADFVTLSPVAATPSHPQTPPLGWPSFAELVGACALPVYALGGLTAEDVAIARAHGAQGVAAIRSFWS